MARRTAEKSPPVVLFLTLHRFSAIAGLASDSFQTSNPKSVGEQQSSYRSPLADRYDANDGTAGLRARSEEGQK